MISLIHYVVIMPYVSLYHSLVALHIYLADVICVSGACKSERMGHAEGAYTVQRNK